MNTALSVEEFVERARLFATAAHAAAGQKRKYTFEDYIVHPIQVAEIVKNIGGTPAMICAAYLHDVLEDTKVPEYVLRTEFGNLVTDMVVWLTKVEVPGNRKVRKEAELRRLYGAPEEVQTIKLADLLANTPSIVKHDPKFAKVYLREKQELLEVLTNGDKTLLKRAQDQLKSAMEYNAKV
jgi:(p)ppGpp synthase/HD superfamily hydrolase